MRRSSAHETVMWEIDGRLATRDGKGQGAAHIARRYSCEGRLGAPRPLARGCGRAVGDPLLIGICFLIAADEFHGCYHCAAILRWLTMFLFALPSSLCGQVFMHLIRRLPSSHLACHWLACAYSQVGLVSFFGGAPMIPKPKLGAWPAFHTSGAPRSATPLEKVPELALVRPAAAVEQAPVVDAEQPSPMDDEECEWPLHGSKS